MDEWQNNLYRVLLSNALRYAILGNKDEKNDFEVSKEVSVERKVNVIEDLDGKKTVFIHDIFELY